LSFEREAVIHILTSTLIECNLGKMYQVWSLANSTQGQDPCPSGSDCACCYESALLGAYYDLCPTGDIDFVGGFVASTNATFAVAGSSNQCAILRSPSDPNKACPVFGSTPFGAKEYLDPISLPSGFPGTTLTDNAGYVTALGVSGSTTVLSWPDLTTTITYASFTGVSSMGSSSGNPTLSPAATGVLEAVSWTYNPSASASTSATGSSGSASATQSSTSAGVTSARTTGTSAAQGSPSTTTSGSAAAATTTKSAAARSSNGSYWWVLALGVVLYL